MKDGRHVVLYIDDDQDALFAIRAVLEASGYAMVEASSAEDGLKVYKTAKPDFVIVDLMMEEVDSGASFAKELKALGNKVPVYMLSSVGDDLSTSTDSVALGLDGVFQKPLAPATLLKVLKTKLQ
ncbi:MAG TPA: response regulator [Thermoanaerobaculaceae bacterium]|mgnify:CR=1 FL=1|nr:response regulator [Thermoanaerobaculaceae bacterium]HPS79830.1 response regulator [Thermoanaerobaculaceae bacterium]